jgi:acid phosphatase type 7
MNFSNARMVAAVLTVLVFASCASQASKEVVQPIFNQPLITESQPAPTKKQEAAAAAAARKSVLPNPATQTLSLTKFYRLMIKDDPATSLVIGYSLALGSTLQTKVYYGEKDFGTEIEKYSDDATPTVTNQFKGLNNYFVELKRLKADTVYYFVVSDGKGVSPRYSFRTTPDSNNTKLSVIAGGDSRSNQRPRQMANLLVPKLRPHFVMFAGDMTSGGTDLQWAEWFQDWQLTVARDGRMTALVMTRGNHEVSNEIVEKLFNTPKNIYYAVSFANDLLRVYTLNSEMPAAGAQTEWLKADLDKNSHVKFKFAQYHRPIRPHTRGKSDNSSGYSYWAPLFYQYGVNLVSEADAHTVKYTWPIRPSTVAGSQEGFVRDDAAGTTYIGEGCWGAPLRANDDIRGWTRDTARFNSFHWIYVDSKKVEVRTVKVDNAQAVGELSDKTRFSAPDNLDVWTPSNGAVVTIQAH